jgi:hypothetical protein
MGNASSSSLAIMARENSRGPISLPAKGTAIAMDSTVSESPETELTARTAMHTLTIIVRTTLVKPATSSAHLPGRQLEISLEDSL